MVLGSVIITVFLRFYSSSPMTLPEKEGRAMHVYNMHRSTKEEVLFQHVFLCLCSHGDKKVFSCQGIQLAVNWFWDKGLQDITVFIPLWRKEPQPQALITGRIRSAATKHSDPVLVS